MEDVIELYALPLDEKSPVVCFDESPFQLLREVREPMSGRQDGPGARIVNTSAAASLR